MYVDFIQNGQGFGPVGEQVASCRFDPGLMRPYLDEAGRKCVTVNTGRKKLNPKTGRYEPDYRKELVGNLVNNGIMVPAANAMSLRKDEWIQLDSVVLKAARQRLRAWTDLAAANTFGGFNAMSKTILEHETESDPGFATVSMDGLADDMSDTPLFQLEGLPLPLTHSGFRYSSRTLAVSRNTGTPLDTNGAEKSARRVAELIERTLIGTTTGITFGTAANYNNSPSVWGYTNHPDRITKTNMTAPTSSNGTTQLSDWLTCRDLLYDAGFYGPFMVYTSTDYDEFLDNDFKTNSDKSLRQRLLEIDGVGGIRRLDFLTNTFTTIWVQMTADVARAINGMDITTVQWEGKGGMEMNFKVMAIMVPQIRSDYNGNMGLLHATTA